MRDHPEKHKAFAYALILLLLVAFCAPFTIFEEASACLADTESELVHYYLTPLPDNGEACVAIPVFACPMLETDATEQARSIILPTVESFFFHPPKRFLSFQHVLLIVPQARFPVESACTAHAYALCERVQRQELSCLKL